MLKFETWYLLVVCLLLFGERRLVLTAGRGLVLPWMIELSSFAVAITASSFKERVVLLMVELLLVLCDIHFLSKILLVYDFKLELRAEL